jgi:hypothetical protein
LATQAHAGLNSFEIDQKSVVFAIFHKHFNRGWAERQFGAVNSWLPCVGAALFHALFNAQIMGPVIHNG